MKTEVREITPTVANEMLKRNINNRKPSESHIGFLSKEMSAGNWKFDGQPLRFSDNGGLLDGQHRLHAVIKSKTTQKFLVLTGINSDAFHVMDTGKIRTGGDVFGINGVQSSTVCAAAVKIIMSHKRGQNAGFGDAKISNSDLWAFFKENSSVEDLVRTSHSLYLEFNRVLPLTTIVAFRFLMSEKNVLDSDNFWRSVCSGLALEKESPERVLRQKLIADKVSKSTLPFREKKAIIFKAWNAYRAKKSVKVLRWNKETEKFPVIL